LFVLLSEKNHNLTPVNMSQTVDPTLAAECVEQYTKMYTSNDTKAILNAYSESVSFPIYSVTDFMTAATTASTADTLEIKFGVYTEAFCAKYPGAVVGRLTLFLYTKGHGLGDPPRDVFNTGDLTP
jgi:hypothetical protein